MGYEFQMENQLNSPRDSDFSSDWMHLSQRVNARATDLSARTVGTHLANDAAALANDARMLCEHIERIHRDAGEILNDKPAGESVTIGNVDPALNTEEAQREAVKIRREGHEMRADFKDIIKALFMWQDDPVERAHGTQKSPGGD